MSATSFESPQLMPDPLPLRIDDQGAIRIGNSRITLDILVEDFEAGSTPEEIVANYEALQRGDVYAVLGYYLNHRGEVEEYLRRRELEATQIENQLR